MAKPKRAKDIDDYMSQFPADVQAILQKVRSTISSAAPEAKETISYLMPAFKLHGMLVYFAAWEKHIGLYPPISGDKTLEKAVARYAGPKGNLQFPLDEPIPQSCASARQPHGPGETTRMRRCTSSASSTGPIASFRAARSTGRR
jgi:uncharacterized protein YdhG (YjbR/CyaY superfamily)